MFEKERRCTNIHHIHIDRSFLRRLILHFLPPSIPWLEVPDKLGDVLLVTLSFPSAFPRIFKSSNNLYEGMKGFGDCPAAVAGFQVLVFCGFLTMADPLFPLTGNELLCCMKGLDACAV